MESERSARIDAERIARIEEHLKWLSPHVSKMDGKLDILIEWRWKVWGVSATVSVLCAAGSELLIAVFKHS